MRLDRHAANDAADGLAGGGEGRDVCADFIGLDTVLAIAEVLHDGLGDPKYRPCPLLRQYVDAGRLGRKAGRGFFDYRT